MLPPTLYEWFARSIVTLSVRLKMPSVNPNPESAAAPMGPPKLATPLMLMAGPVPACVPGTRDCARVAYCRRASFHRLLPNVGPGWPADECCRSLKLLARCTEL